MLCPRCHDRLLDLSDKAAQLRYRDLCARSSQALSAAIKSGVTAVRSQAVTITLDDAREVSGLLQTPPVAGICYVLAHGAGAGMSHPFMADVANGLAERGIATLRYQCPYMEQGSKRPDAPQLAQATVRAAVIAASHFTPKLALVFLGFPLHPAGRPSNERGNHL